MKNQLIIKGTNKFKQCHASTILRHSDGTLQCCFFAGSEEGKNDVAIWTSYCRQDNWSSPEILVKSDDTPHWNPVLFSPNPNLAYLYYKTGETIADWRTFFIKSKDNGITWSNPEELVPGDTSGGRGPVKNKPILLSDKIIASPSSTEQGQWRAFVDLSSDGGKTWRRSSFVPAPSEEHKLIQPTLWQSSQSKLHMLLRSNKGKIYRSDSDDAGLSWSTAYPTSLPNNNSGIDLVKTSDGLLLVIYNPESKDWGTRRQLCLAFSSDNGKTWRNKKLLNSSAEDKCGEEKNEYSYPAIIYSEGIIYLVYTYHRRNIKFISGSISKLLNNLPDY
jgi:predicted neuraminidase